jgi:hypothetical protein
VTLLWTYQDVELLPSFGEVHLVVEGVGVADVHERQVLQHQAHVGNARWSENFYLYEF